MSDAEKKTMIEVLRQPSQEGLDALAKALKPMTMAEMSRPLSAEEQKKLDELLAELRNEPSAYPYLTKSEYRKLMISKGKGEDWWS